MSQDKKLGIAFLWHMHQPFYKDTIANKYLMPWVRLHGVKDYFPMAALAEDFEEIRVSFNLVPSLVEQINDYVQNGATDTMMDLTAKKASSLSLDEKLEMLNNFFKVNFKRALEPNARYLELFMKKGINPLSGHALKGVISEFSTQDFLDLQVLFNLAWFHSISIDKDVNLRDLINKKKFYSEGDKEYILLKQREILTQILPLYRRLQDEGRIEITTTPYYHPIVPLLCDTSIARASSPGMKLPKKRFSHPEDAAWHIEEAIKYYTLEFGRPPRGMWPSEGSVSDQTLDLMISKGIDWVATDEDILFNSFHLDKRLKGSTPSDRRAVYRPYNFKRDSRHITMIFRDKNLSNMISFNYNSYVQAQAAYDLIGHFKRISENLKSQASRALLTIVMDGENAWEYYADNGRQFFETLYSNIDRTDGIYSTTISDFLDISAPQATLSNVFPGSWIDHNFEIWIGQEQDNVSWEYLQTARRDLVKFTDEFHKKSKDDASFVKNAWRSLYIAEGSDWNWWYSGKAHLGQDNPFDKLYMMHLRNIYKYFKKPIPDFLKISIA